MEEATGLDEIMDLAHMAGQVDAELATSLLTKVEAECKDLDALQELAARTAGATLSAPGDRLKWAEGIITVFADREWARQAYDDLKDSFTDERQRAAYDASRQHRLEQRL